MSFPKCVLAAAVFSISFGVFAKEDQTCKKSYELPQNQWRMISLPCEPPSGARTVQAIFGDDLSGAYDTDWVVYGYNSGYQKQALSSELKQGKGYWINSVSQEAKLDLPAGSNQTPTASSEPCVSNGGCFASPITTNGSKLTWNLLGNPYLSTVAISDIRILTDGETSPNNCGDANACTLDEAKADGIFNGQLWNYRESEGNFPLTSADKLEPWMGYWGSTLDKAIGLNPRLLMPSPSTTSGSDLLLDEGFENGTDQWKAVPAFFNMSNESREGNQSVHFLPDTSGGKRSELVLKDRKGHFDWGKEYWVGFSINVQVPPEGYRIISQHHSTTGVGADGEADWSVPAGGNSFTIRTQNGDFVFYTATDPGRVDQGPSARGATRGSVSITRPYTLSKWHDIVLHFRYATDSSGIMEVWMDGEQIVNVRGPSVYKFDMAGRPKSPRQIQKIGIYHGTAEPVGEVLYDAYRIGGPDSSYKDVAPR